MLNVCQECPRKSEALKASLPIVKQNFSLTDLFLIINPYIYIRECSWNTNTKKSQAGFDPPLALDHNLLNEKLTP